MDNSQVTKDQVGNDLVLDKEFITSSHTNSINVPNTNEAYEEYFKMGGTIRKMSMSSTQKYSNFIKNYQNSRKKNQGKHSGYYQTISNCYCHRNKKLSLKTGFCNEWR